MSQSRFDPAAHLHKHGWKGKGTALKQGHATRHIAVSQKKTLSGLGKDRDEAIPFWDHIFAATAASLSIPSSGTSTPLSASASLSPAPVMQKAPSTWQTHNSPTVSVTARVGRESAKRGLYSRFLRGAVLSETPDEPTPEPPMTEEPNSAPVSEAGPSSLPTDKTDGETKEERRARRAAKAARKAEKERHKQRKNEVSEETAVDTRRSVSVLNATASNGDGKKKRQKREARREDARVSSLTAAKKRKDESIQEEPHLMEIMAVKNDGGDNSLKRKRRKKSPSGS